MAVFSRFEGLALALKGICSDVFKRERVLGWK
jgi:hypothetical protein